MKAERKEKIAIFGGSFDPPHYGHYDIVKNLEKSFDRVIVVPSYISPFKTGAAASDASSKTRLMLCKKVFASNKTEVCSREISKKGVSYSVDTAKYFAKKYKDSALTWVIGSEELCTLDKWKDFDTLKKIVKFLVVPRPEFPASDADIKVLKKRGASVKIAKFDGLDISSTQIKIDIAFGKPNKFMPECVKRSAEKTGLFDPYGKYVDALYKYDLSDKRLVHSYGVALRGAELAKMYGYPVHDAVVACILHDIAKSTDPAEYAGKVDTAGFPAPTIHGPIGAYIARREFGVDEQTEHAIRYHSTGDGQMSLLDEIVYLADKTEFGRTYNEVFYFRYLCRVDRDMAMYRALNAVTNYRETLPCEYTSRAIALYEKRCGGREAPEMPVRTKPSRTAVTETVKLPIVRTRAELSELKSKTVRVVPTTDKSLRVVEPEKNRHGAGGASDSEVKEMAMTMARELDLHKAHDIDIIDLCGKTIIADYFVIASASSTTAVKALMGYVEDIMTKKYGVDPSRRDVDGEWVALDYGGVIVHIFTDKTREFYDIERLWSDGSNVTRIGDN